jgi:hypothetical protein
LAARGIGPVDPFGFSCLGLFRCENPRFCLLDSFGFPWILSSESSLFNGLRWKIDENFFSGLFPGFCSAGMGADILACGRAALLIRLILTGFPIFSNQLSPVTVLAVERGLGERAAATKAGVMAGL